MKTIKVILTMLVGLFFLGISVMGIVYFDELVGLMRLDRGFIRYFNILIPLILLINAIVFFSKDKGWYPVKILAISALGLYFCVSIAALIVSMN